MSALAERAADTITAERLIAIVRAGSADEAVLAAEALLAAGVRVIEVSLVTPGALSALTRLSESAGDERLIGAGTVRSRADAVQATAAGARFLVSPGLDPGVLGWSIANDVLHLPGALSPSEVGAALAGGAQLVKLFPAGRLGAGYVRDLLAPFPEARLVPTGGIDGSNAGAFLDAGAVAVAVGSALVNPVTAADPEALGSAVRQLQSITRL